MKLRVGLAAGTRVTPRLAAKPDHRACQEQPAGPFLLAAEIDGQKSANDRGGDGGEECAEFDDPVSPRRGPSPEGFPAAGHISRVRKERPAS